MPTPEFTWNTYEIRVPAGSVSPLLAAAAGVMPADTADTTTTITIPLPDLHAWPSPLDKAEILLESAAEIEHALMAQYLYAAYSLKSSEEVTDPAQQAVLDETSSDSWPRTLLGIAREEMGHLMSVQNLLMLLGLAPNFEREDFPPRKDLYPFSLHLERLSQKSLAKYVVAEAPLNPVGIDKIIEMAEAAQGAKINHVGILYGLLGLVFATKEQVQQGGSSGSVEWDDMVRQIAQFAYLQAPEDAWHLPESAFFPQSTAQQANPADWQVGGLRVHRVADRTAALQAIRDIGEQGEGPTNAGAKSHFERFLDIYQGGNGRIPFPAEGEWIPTRDVPTDPKVGVQITEPRTRRWAELADQRYALLLGFLEHYLQASGDDRLLLTGWIFAEMRSRVGFIARKLTSLPREGAGGAAAICLTLPGLLHLPGAETARWRVHQERTEVAITIIEQMQAADAADQADPYLSDLLRSDQARLTLINGRTIGPGATTSFARDILPLFRPVDIEHMRDMLGMDLSVYDVVRASAQHIFKRVKGIGPIMPPVPDQPWTKAQIDLFAKWMTDEFPP